LFLLAVLVALGSVAYLNRDRIFGMIGSIRRASAVEETGASEELAQRAGMKLDDLESGREPLVALSGNELQSLLTYRFPQLLPPFVDSPTIELKDDRILVTARVPIENMPNLSELGDAAGFLPDTTEVGMTGSILPLDSGRVALAVDDVSASRIPLPDRLIPGALRRLGRKDEPGLPRDALAVPLPPGATAAYVRGDSLYLLARPRSARN